jgi:hypothetical protein
VHLERQIHIFSCAISVRLTSVKSATFMDRTCPFEILAS